MSIRKLTLFILSFLFTIFLSNSQSTASKSVTRFKIEAPQLKTIKQIWLYLPKNYKSSKKRYPVIYMPDAQNLFDNATSYSGEWHVDEFMDQLNSKQAIVVGIEHGNDKRIDELSPFKHETYGGGKADAFLEFITQTLKPKIDDTYRTKTGAKHTAIIGSSLGGLFSFYATVNMPDVFGFSGVFSPSFWFNPEIYELTTATNICKSSKFYFVVGEDEPDEMHQGLQKMIILFEQKQIKKKQYYYTTAKNHSHNETLWSTYFPVAYRWFFNVRGMQ